MFTRRNTQPPFGGKNGQNLTRNLTLPTRQKSNCSHSQVKIPQSQVQVWTVENNLSNYNEFLNSPKMDDPTLSKDNPLENSLSSRRRPWFGGLRDDLKRYGYYKSDIKNGFNLQCLAAIIFNAFTQISGCIAFGGLMGAKTENTIGITETLLASAFGGLFFSLLAGQPILIVGTTGPLLLFDAGLFNLCKSHDIDFLASRTWIGLWLIGIAIIFSGFEGSRLIRFLTKFTQEIFAALISLLFVAESLINLIDIYKAHPLQQTYGVCQTESNETSKIGPGPFESNQPNTALLSTLLMFGTFFIAWTLRSFRNSRFFTKNIRNAVSNFAGPVAILSMVLVDYFIKETITQKLTVPDGLEPTQERNWFIKPATINSWIPVLAILPAFLLFVLIFMEVAISELIVSKKENKMMKGTGLHLDIFVVSLMNTFMSFFGLPWASVAIVRSVAHCTSLTIWSQGSGSKLKPFILGVREQRLTNLIISILTGISVAMTPVLVIIPMAVIFGIFLFMGVASMNGIQFFERILLFFQLPENHPQVPFVTQVSTGKMYGFTLIQLFWLLLLWTIKYTPAALSFPFILLILVPFRFYILPFLFSKDELAALD